MAGTFPSRGVWRRPNLRPVDLIVFAALLTLLYGLLRLAPALNAPFLPKTAPSTVSTDPADLPYCAVRSLLRMFIALILSVLFTFVYAEAAARLRRAEKVLIPLLYILQSVPVLGFLTVTATAFINLFPGSELGLECASIFAAMAWNMTFAFYHSLISQPRDLDEAARVMRLSHVGIAIGVMIVMVIGVNFVFWRAQPAGMAQAVPRGGNEVRAVTSPGPVIVEAKGVTKTFTTPDGRALPVLDDISLSLCEGEIVALLGKSGSGKSTMLRCIAGLIAPSAGTVAYRGTPLNGANPGVAMVFQSFALLPWLTVQQNVELAMQARDVPLDVRHDRALRVIDLIGLLPLVDAAVMLGLAEVHDADLEITEVGCEFATGDIDASKILFGKLASERAPLIKAIVSGLRATNDGTLREGFFLDLPRRGFSAEEARRQLDIAIDWGRYGELFEYGSESGQLVLGSDPAKVGV